MTGTETKPPRPPYFDPEIDNVEDYAEPVIPAEAAEENDQC